MNNVNNMIPALNTVFAGLTDGTLKASTAAQMNNAVGKMISVVKLQMDYAKLRNESPDIAFMHPAA